MNRFSLLLLSCLALVCSCQKIFEKPRWETHVVAPLVTTTLGVDDIFKDTSFTADGDTIKFVQREDIYDLELIDTLVKLKVNPYTKNVKLSTLKLAPQTVTRKVTLGELAKAMAADGNATGAIIMGLNGQFMAVPDINDLTAGPMDVDINQFFEYAEMNNPGGTMDIKIENGLPLTISRLEFELKNKTLATPPIAHEIFNNILPGTSQNSTVDLSDKVMEGNMQVNVLDMDIKGGFVKIDTSDAIIITLTIQNISVRSATAVFPEQDVVNETQYTPLQGMDDVRLRKAKVETGMVYAEAYSTAEDTIYFTYSIPSAYRNNNPLDTFVMKAKILPDPVGGTKQTFSADFSGYSLDLTGFKDSVNTIKNTITGHIQYTGKKVNLSLQDSLTILVTMKDVTATYVEGYLGRDTIDAGSGSVSFGMFKALQGGTLNFEKVKLNLVVENGLGLDGQVVLKNLQSRNSSTGETRTLNPLPFVGTIQKAASQTQAVTTTIPVTGSNLVDLLNIKPDVINYSVELRTNTKDYTPGVYPDFAERGRPLNAHIDVELPLSVLADQIVLSDTTDFIEGQLTTTVKSGSFSVLVNNGFPVGGDLKLYFLDNTGITIDSAIFAGSILPGIPDAQGRVTQKVPSKISFYVDEHRMQNILQSKRIVFKVKFSTPNSGVPGSFVKLFSDYTMDFKIVGDFSYMIE